MSERILICGVNWLGDSIMSMPAIQLLKVDRPDARLTLLTHAGLEPLWRLHGAPDSVRTFARGLRGTLAAARQVRGGRFDRAYILPNSFRSALIPFLGAVPVRRGAPGHHRAWMLTETVATDVRPEGRHQAWEYVAILGVAAPGGALPRLEIAVAPETVEQWRGVPGLSGDAVRVGLLPGAARGPSKRWPAEHFIEAGRGLAAATGCRVIVLGSESERALCDSVAAAIGASATSLAGRTSLADLAAVLSLCPVVVTNDSGGMHLAAAVGAKVVALFGLTDPGKTGPLGAGHRILTCEGVSHDREIDRDSPEARTCLQRISPARVVAAAAELLGGASR